MRASRGTPNRERTAFPFELNAKKLLLAELEAECERLFGAGRDDDQAAVMVQRVGLGGHGLDGDAHAVGRRVNLDGVVLLVASFLPDVDASGGTLKRNRRAAAVLDALREAEAVVDELVANFAPGCKARVFLEVSGGEVGLVEQGERVLGERHGEPVNLFAEHEVRVPSFGIGHVRVAEVRDARDDVDAFAREGDGVRGAVGEREAREGARPVAGENGGAAFIVALKRLEFPFLVLQESVEGVRGPADVVD